jgi:hypothetical protein
MCPPNRSRIPRLSITPLGAFLTIFLWAMIMTGCTRPSARPAAATPAIFRDAAAEAGLIFTHQSGAAGEFLMPEIMGSGAALFDMDNDGDLDAYLVQSAGAGKLFRNLLADGKLRFEDATAASGIDTANGYGMGAATGDFDGDGLVDLLITGYQSNALYRNLGGGRFTAVPLPQPRVWSTSASFFDYDRDGRLDLVILSYVNFTRAGNKRCFAATGEPDYCTPKAYSPVSARLYHNDGNLRWTDVTARSGIDRALGPGLGVTAADFNRDGWPDLFVANDTAQNHLWLNQRNGTFREVGLEAGVAYSEDGLAKAGMGVSAGDFDGDGDEDLFVLNLMREGATLFQHQPNGPSGLPAFLDVTRQTGLYQMTFPFTGFGTAFLDYDNDGRLDLFLANGAVTLREEQRGQTVPYRERKLLIRNLDGRRFADVSAQGGAIFEQAEVSRGAAFGDIDNDGRADILVNNNNGPARLLLNEGPRAGWLSVRLSGGLAHGAYVTLYREDLAPLVRRAQSDGSYCSASDLRVHFGLGDKPAVGAIEVLWPDGHGEKWLNPGSNRLVELKKGTGQRP